MTCSFSKNSSHSSPCHFLSLQLSRQTTHEEPESSSRKMESIDDDNHGNNNNNNNDDITIQQEIDFTALDNGRMTAAASSAWSEGIVPLSSSKLPTGSDSGSCMTSHTMSLSDLECQLPLQLPSRSTPDLIIGLREEKEFDRADDRKTSKSFSSSKILPILGPSSTMMQSCEPEVDSRDPPVAVEPLHIVGSSDVPPSRGSISKVSPTPVTPRKPRLTLSAFRRPEQTVRLTRSDPSRMLESEYDLRSPECRVLGHGAFSTVRLAIRLCDGVRVAVKSIAKHEALRARRLRRGGSSHLDEWEILRLMENNPYIISLIDVFETDEEIHLITEYCEGGELFDAIQKKGNRRSSFRRGRFSEPQASRITNQILRALVDIHSHNIVHRDVKPENILLVSQDESDLQVKLCDFGVARLHREKSDSPSDGESSPSTPGLAYTTNDAPEVCHGAEGPAIDVYALGVTLYILLCGFPPVFCDEQVVFPDAYWDDISEEAKAIIRKMLHPNPCQRITAAASLQDPWIRQQTTRVRRGSISANLELVRARLSKSLGDNMPAKRVRSFCTVSPRKRRMSLDLAFSINDLYGVSEKRDIRVVNESIEVEVSEDGLKSAPPLEQKVACG